MDDLLDSSLVRTSASESGLATIAPQPSQTASRFPDIVDSLTDYAIVLLDLEGRIIAFSRGATQMTGYLEEEAVGEHFSIILTPEDRDAGIPEQELRDAREKDRSEREGWRQRKDGTRFWGNEIITPRRGTEGELLGFTEITRDLSERKRMEDALRESEERCQGVVDSVREYAIFRIDAEKLLATWNLGVERVFGYSSEEWIGQKASIIFTPEDVALGEDEKEMETAIVAGQAPDERWHLRKDGSRFWGSGILTSLFHPESQTVEFSKVVRDNTERKTAEDALRAAHDALEERVLQRTEELSRAVALLEQEVRHRRALETALMRAIDDERQRFGQELHDGLSQHLAGTGLVVGALGNRAEAGGTVELAELRHVGELLDSALSQTRGLARGLHPIAVSNGGLAAALRELAGLVSLSSPCGFIGPDQVDIDAGKALHVYRIAQEAVTNAVKHAHADQITISLAMERQSLVLTVTDNGCGFDGESTAQGMGLHNIQHRAGAMGATLKRQTEPGKGTRLSCAVPLDGNETARIHGADA